MNKSFSNRNSKTQKKKLEFSVSFEHSYHFKQTNEQTGPQNEGTSSDQVVGVSVDTE